MNNGSIFIYRLIEPDALVSLEDQLGRVLFQTSPNDSTRVLQLSPSSGCLYFADNAKLWSARGGVARSPTEAESAARRFMEDANRRVVAANLRGLAGISLFPTEMHLAAAEAMYAPGSSTPDHWLCSFSADLPTGLPDQADGEAKVTRSTATVLNAAVDIRVGAGGAVVGVWSTWRPVRGFETVEALPPPDSDQAPSLIYQAYGHDVPQDLLAPFYLLLDDEDTGSLSPASRYSLLVSVDRDDGPSTARLSAAVSGNMGPLAYSWAAWPLEVGPAAGLTQLGTSRSVDVPPGAYNLILDVQDQLTGAFVRNTYLIYFGEIAPRASAGG